MKSSITVMGPLPKQAEIIKKKCQTKNVRLKFAKQGVPCSGDIIIWTDFVSHSIQQIAVKTVGRDHVRPYHGGLGGLITLIQGMAA